MAYRRHALSMKRTTRSQWAIFLGKFLIILISIGAHKGGFIIILKQIEINICNYT